MKMELNQIFNAYSKKPPKNKLAIGCPISFTADMSGVIHGVDKDGFGRRFVQEEWRIEIIEKAGK